MTTTTTERALLLPGQAAAPEGPVDMTMMYVMHHGFRRDLRAFAETAPHTPVVDRAAWRALAERWQLFAQVLHHHHHGEDTWVWPMLMDRVSSDERATLEAMEAEHAEIDPMLEGCAAALARLADGADEGTRAALAQTLVAAEESLGRHLAHEERDTIALIQRVLTQPEWEALDEHFKEGVSFGEVLRLIPWVMHELPEEARDRLVRHAGSVYRLLWLLARRGFERRERVAFAHRVRG